MSMIKLNLGGYKTLPVEPNKLKVTPAKLREATNSNVVDTINKKIPVTFNRELNRLAKQGKLNLFA